MRLTSRIRRHVARVLVLDASLSRQTGGVHEHERHTDTLPHGGEASPHRPFVADIAFDDVGPSVDIERHDRMPEGGQPPDDGPPDGPAAADHDRRPSRRRGDRLAQ